MCFMYLILLFIIFVINNNYNIMMLIIILYSCIFVLSFILISYEKVKKMLNNI